MEEYKILFFRKNALVQAVIKKSHAEQLIWMLGNYCNYKVIEKLDNKIWTIYEDDLFYIRNVDDEEISEKTPDGSDNRVIFNSYHKIIVINQAENKWNLFYTFRMIRNILRWAIYDESVIFFHGGAVAIDNYGIAYLGSKKTGKTSSILTMVINENASYITNDDLMISFEDDIMAYGWPRSLSVRKDTISLLNIKNDCRIGNEIHPSNVFIKQNNLDVENEYYLPIEISQLGNGCIVPQAKLRAMIFTEFDDMVCENAIIEKLNKKQFKKKLLENVRYLPEKHCLFLKEHFVLPSEENVGEKVEVLCNKIEGYRLKQSFRHLGAGAKCLMKTLYERN